MARRLLVPSTQQDLFAPPPRNPGVASPPGAYVGPVSQVTGGPLNAIEAERVTRNVSIAHAGGVFEDGTTVCKLHQQPLLHDHGFLMVVYCGTGHDSRIGACKVCGAEVVGDDPRAASSSA